MTEVENVAATLREKYWAAYVATRVEPWEATTEGNRVAWIAVAMAARDLWEGIPR